MADDDSSVATPETSKTAQLENQVRISRRYISETERLQAENDQLRAQLRTERQQHRSQLDGFEAWQEHIVTSHQTTRHFYSHNLAVTQHERDMSRAEKEELEDEKARLQARYEKLLSEKDAFEEQAMQKIEMSLRSVSDLEEQLGALQIESLAANESLVVLRQEVVTHTETNATLQAQCDELQSHNERLRHEAESANVAVIEKDQAIASLQGTNRFQEQQIAELQASLAGEREKNERSRQKMAELKQANAKSKQENELSRQKIAEFERANAEKEALAAQSKRENEALHQEIAELKHEHCNLRTRCNKLQYDKETLAANVMSAREINRRLLSEKEQERATMQERYDTLMLEQQMVAEKNIHELLEERRKLTLRIENLIIEVAELTTQLEEELDEIDGGTECNELVLPTHAQSRSVTPARPPSKRGQSMTATTKSSSAVSTSPPKKRSKMSHETTSTSQPKPPASVMPVDDSNKSMTNVDDNQAVKFGTAFDESTSLMPTQDSLGGKKVTLTQSKATKTNDIVLSDRASAKDAKQRSRSSKWTKEAEKEVLTLVQTFEAEGKKVDFNAVTEYLIEYDLLPFPVKKKQVIDRWRNHINPKLIKACFTRYEFEIIIASQTQLLRLNNFTFIAEVLSRSIELVKNTWYNTIQKVLLKTVKSSTGRNNLKVSINGVEKYDFGDEEEGLKAAWLAYENKKGYVANNDDRTVTEDTLPMERLSALARAQNDKNAKTDAEREKRKATAATKAKRDSDRAKKEDDVRAVLKSEEEVKLLEEQEPDSEWVKKKKKAHKAFLRAGHSEEAISKFLKTVRKDIENEPLGRSKSDALRDRRAKERDENRKFLADRTNTM